VPTYAEISDDWFFLLHPKGHSFESFEAEEGTEDREKTRVLLGKMEAELPRTFSELLDVPFEYAPALLHRIDNALNRTAVAYWISRSDPEDPNNEFKLTVCELAVYLGALLVREHGGEWRYARFPNYFQSGVVVNNVEFHVFDTVMKRCSTDRSHETLVQKWQLYEAAIRAAGDPPPILS
jgi:hypothetical protein